MIIHYSLPVSNRTEIEKAQPVLQAYIGLDSRLLCSDIVVWQRNVPS